MKVIGYVRVSTEEQAESGLSLAHQKAKIEAYAAAMDFELVGIIEDAGKSAKNLNREGIQAAMKMIATREAEGLVILKLDRLTRSVKDLGALVELFDKTGAALVSVQDSINTQTAAGRMVLNILGSVAQWEREAIGERTAAALQVKKGRGERVGAIPYGYDLGTDGINLVENSHEQAGLKIIRELRAAGMSLRKIATELSFRGYHPKMGRTWQAKTILNLCAVAV